MDDFFTNLLKIEFVTELLKLKQAKQQNHN